MNKEITFENYGQAKFWFNDWYTIEDLEEILKAIKEVKERQDQAMLNAMIKEEVIK
jgi:hypothetical protein